jgi:DNA-binding CsgD family transcriptional regulator
MDVLVVGNDAIATERVLELLQRDGQICIYRSVPPSPPDVTVMECPLLTRTQREVLQAYAQLGREQDVAEERGCSVRTVKHHLSDIRRLLGVKTTVQAVYIATRAGLI